MKNFIYLTTAVLLIWSCDQSTLSSNYKAEKGSADTIAKTEVNHPLTSIGPSGLLTLTDAEKILGEPGHLSDSGSTTKGTASKYNVKDSVSGIKINASTFRSTYIANSMDKKTGRTGIIYFVLEQYPDESSAKTVYSFYKRGNQNKPDFKELPDLGDEAWFGTSPLFVYVRKGDKIVVLKVNKMTGMTSLEEFNRVSKHIADAL
ncbi:MAG TPA: hypothetical protein VMY77_09680 [Chitinophagaceae bacterium]|nr:hypothetical protein [Chitinophagaceae bacterium]